MNRVKVKALLDATNIPNMRTKMKVLYGKANDMTSAELTAARDIWLETRTKRVAKLKELDAPAIILDNEVRLLRDGDYFTKLVAKFSD